MLAFDIDHSLPSEQSLVSFNEAFNDGLKTYLGVQTALTPAFGLLALPSIPALFLPLALWQEGWHVKGGHPTRTHLTRRWHSRTTEHRPYRAQHAACNTQHATRNSTLRAHAHAPPPPPPPSPPPPPRSCHQGIFGPSPWCICSCTCWGSLP